MACKKRMTRCTLRRLYMSFVCPGNRTVLRDSLTAACELSHPLTALLSIYAPLGRVVRCTVCIHPNLYGVH